MTDPKINPHNFVEGENNHCLICKKHNYHPIHNAGPSAANAWPKDCYCDERIGTCDACKAASKEAAVEPSVEQMDERIADVLKCWKPRELAKRAILAEDKHHHFLAEINKHLATINKLMEIQLTVEQQRDALQLRAERAENFELKYGRERDALQAQLDASNSNHRQMAKKMSELGSENERLQQRIGELEQDIYSKWRKQFEAGEILLYGWTSDQIKSALRQYRGEAQK